MLLLILYIHAIKCCFIVIFGLNFGKWSDYYGNKHVCYTEFNLTHVHQECNKLVDCLTVAERMDIDSHFWF